ncbi:SIS domain-containing protein [Taklimakanibacter albus]|uniref:SIS domain-containing protein n=1 Tax=Taklimakanibacter albus TaxID=2800327 RepID=A0ACC5QZC0_9HYPH|nr:SIS domain-containing protein [Aestuariivirga sp. YIM B02566]MBK1865538.1 SIS domain-containing protein [Aestuariivirga sp. YIM B02566]
MKTALNPDVESALRPLSGRAISHVFLVACGGSLSIMQGGKYFIDRHSAKLSSDLFNADEFVCRDPKRLGPDALVILCSQTGTTSETVRAAEHARGKGALTIAMTLDPVSPLAKACEFTLAYQASYTTGIAIDAADSNYAVLYMLLAGLLRITDGVDLTGPLLTSLSALQPAIYRAHQVFAGRFASFAPRFRDKSAIYALASGPAYGAAYSFSTCVLMEMQWYDSQAIHANEFFHGPFEVVDENAAFIVLVGSDETRRLSERARDFLLRFGSRDNILVLDSDELDLTAIDRRFQTYLLPLVFFDTLWKFAYRLADLRGRPMLEGRRYMKKITGY